MSNWLTTRYGWLDDLDDADVQREAMRELCRTDLFFLCKFVLQYHDIETTTDIHVRLCEELDKNPFRFLVLMFRGSFKTSISLGKVIQWLINDPAAQIGIGSDTKERAIDRVRDLRDVLQSNKKLHYLFPEIFYNDPEHESPLWKLDEFTVRRPGRDERTGGFSLASVTAFGLDPLPTGSHYTHVWLDDVENDFNCNSDTQTDKLLRNLSLFTPIPRVHAPIFMTGTIYSKHGCNTVFQQEWPTYKCPIVDRYGHPTFPSLYGRNEIERIHRECKDEWTWGGQYLLKAYDREDRYLFPFKGKQFKYGELSDNVFRRDGHEIKLDECLIYITVDPSGGANEQQGRQNPKLDKAGVCVNAVDLSGHWNICELYKKYLDDDQFLDELFALDTKWRPYLIGIEKMPHLDSLIRRAMKDRGHTLKLVELKPNRRKKADRIRGLLPLLPDITLADHLLGKDRELAGWHTEVEHGDDDWDAFAYQIDIARKPDRGIINQTRIENRKVADRSRLAEMSEGERAEWTHWIEVEQKSLSHNQEAKDFQDDLMDFYAETR